MESLYKIKAIDSIRSQVLTDRDRTDLSSTLLYRSKKVPSTFTQKSSNSRLSSLEHLSRDVSHRYDSNPKLKPTFHYNETQLHQILGIQHKSRELPTTLHDIQAEVNKYNQKSNKNLFITNLQSMKLKISEQKSKILEKIIKDSGNMNKSQSGVINSRIYNVYDNLLKKNINDPDLGNPSGRKEVEIIIAWLENMIKTHVNDPKDLATEEKTQRAQLIYTACYKEVARQVSVHCIERGILMKKIWNAQIDLFCKKEEARVKEIQEIQQKFKSSILHNTEECDKKLKASELYSKDLENIIKAKDDQIAELNLKIEELNIKSNQLDYINIKKISQTDKQIELDQKNTVDNDMTDAPGGVFHSKNVSEADLINNRPLNTSLIQVVRQFGCEVNIAPCLSQPIISLDTRRANSRRFLLRRSYRIKKSLSSEVSFDHSRLEKSKDDFFAHDSISGSGTQAFKNIAELMVIDKPHPESSEIGPDLRPRSSYSEIKQEEYKENILGTQDQNNLLSYVSRRASNKSIDLSYQGKKQLYDTQHSPMNPNFTTNQLKDFEINVTYKKTQDKNIQVDINPIPDEELTLTQIQSTAKHLYKALKSISDDPIKKQELANDMKSNRKASEMANFILNLMPSEFWIDKDTVPKLTATKYCQTAEEGQMKDLLQPSLSSRSQKFKNRLGSKLATLITAASDKNLSKAIPRSQRSVLLTEEFNIGLIHRKIILIHPGQRLLSSLIDSLKAPNDIKSDISLKSLMKSINFIYQEKINLCKENSNYKKYEVSMILYEFLMNKYGLKHVAENKFRQIAVAAYLYREKYARVKNFYKFLVLDGNYQVNEWNFYLYCIEVIETCNIGKNIFNEDTAVDHFSPLVRAGQCIHTIFDSKLPENIVDQIFIAVQRLKVEEVQSNLKKSLSHKVIEPVNTDRFLEIMIYHYISLKDVVNRTVFPSYSKDEVFKEDEYLDLLKISKKTDEETLKKYFETYSVTKKLDEDRKERVISLRAVLSIIVDYSLIDLKEKYESL